MGFTDPTIRQHFISQAEQRLNATGFNPEKIFKFLVVDHERALVAPGQSVKISANLMLHDLFSFDRAPGTRLRSNLEARFQQYEKGVRQNTNALLQKLNSGDENISYETFELFRSKLLNFFRNPYSVKKILNSLPTLMLNVHPTNPSVYNDYLRVLNGNKPHMKYVCAKLEISESEYERWLRLLFLMLEPMIPGQPNFFEQFFRTLCGNRETWFMAQVFSYSDKTCLLSDRGFTTLNDENDVHESWNFNLSAQAFVIFSFSHLERFYHNHPGPKPPIPSIGIERMKDFTKDMMSIRHYRNRYDMLSVYNQQVVAQSHQHVFGASKKLEGITFSGKKG